MPRVCLSLLASATLVLVAGCATIMPASVTNLSAARAENPLATKAPLKYSKVAQGVPFSEGERKCTTWPIEDELEVTATDEQICVKGKLFKLVQFGEPSGHSISIQSDGSADKEMADGETDKRVEMGRARKVGQCVEDNRVSYVWEEPYDGCVPNKDRYGAPALTQKSTFLQVGNARWRFDANGAPPLAAEPAAKSAPSN